MMRKRILYGFIVLLLVVAVPLTLVSLRNRQDTRSRASTSAVQFYFNPALSENVAPGTELFLNLRMNTNGNSVAAIDLTITYDKDKLELVKVEDNRTMFGVNILTNTPNNTTGTFRYTATVKDNNPVNAAELEIANFTFKAKPVSGTANGAQIGFTNLKVATSGQANNSLTANFDIARVTIASSTSTSKPLLCQYYGDVNADNVLSADDVSLMTAIASGATSSTFEQRKNSDLNNDGQIDQLDINLLQAYLAGNTTPFPICSNPPVCTNPNSFSATVLGCEQCLACGSLTWCENMLQGNVGGARMSGCVYNASNCQSRAGTPRTSCPAQLVDNPVCVSLTPTVTNGSSPLSVGFTGVGKNDYGTIYRMKIDWGDGTPGTDMSYGGVIGSTVTRQFEPHIYSVPGQYTATLTVYGNDSTKNATSNACKATITVGAVPTRTPTPTVTPTRTPTPTLTNTPTPSPTRTPLVCDNDKDNDLDTDDYNVWLTEFRADSGTRSDCDGESGITIFDYAKWLGEYRKFIAQQ